MAYALPAATPAFVKPDLQRRFRLTKSTEFERVRSEGKSYAHPLIVLIVKSGLASTTRFAVVAGRRIGNAVIRNRAKRLLRTAIQAHLPAIKPGLDVILIARTKLVQSDFLAVNDAVKNLLTRAHLFKDANEN